MSLSVCMCVCLLIAVVAIVAAAVVFECIVCTVSPNKCIYRKYKHFIDRKMVLKHASQRYCTIAPFQNHLYNTYVYMRMQHASGNNTTVKRNETEWEEKKEKTYQQNKSLRKIRFTRRIGYVCAIVCRVCVEGHRTPTQMQVYSYCIQHITSCTIVKLLCESSIEPLLEKQWDERLKNWRGKAKDGALDPKISVLILVLEHIIYFP